MEKNKVVQIGFIAAVILVACQAVLLIKVALDYNELQNSVSKIGSVIPESNKDADASSKLLEQKENEIIAKDAEIAEHSETIEKMESEIQLLDAQCANLLGLDEVETNGYEENYPDLYVGRPADQEQKIVYLTFDDGPSNLTPQFLDVLDQYDVKATFFVAYHEGKEEIYKQIIDRGNAIQIHTTTHDFNLIYRSVEDYLEDFEEIWRHVYDVTGVKCNLFRFPGGSLTGSAKSMNTAIAREMNRRGFDFFDWNVSAGDGLEGVDRYSVVSKIKSESVGRNRIVMLAHDSGGKYETLAALPEVIKYFIEEGYEFGILDHTVNPVDFQFLDWR